MLLQKQLKIWFKENLYQQIQTIGQIYYNNKLIYIIVLNIEQLNKVLIH